MERINGQWVHYVLEVSKHVVMFLTWCLEESIRRKTDDLKLSLLITLPAHTSVFLLLLVQIGLNMLYLLQDAPREYAVRLLLKLCRKVLVSVDLKH